MALMKVSQYRKQCFVEGSQPSVNTIKRWIDDGELPGEIIGGMYYVEVDRVKPVNPMLLKVLNHGSKTEKARQ